MTFSNSGVLDISGARDDNAYKNQTDHDSGIFTLREEKFDF
jgi:hypothetical protein